MSMRTIKITNKSTAPLLMHNVRLANPFSEYTQRLSELNREKKRKGADKEAIQMLMAEVEWRGGLYYDEKVGLHIPARMVRKNLNMAARMTKEGKKVERAVICTQPMYALEYDGPRDIDELFEDKAYWDQRIVRVGQAKVPRTRPIIYDWSVEVELAYDPDGITRDDIIRFMRDGGRFEGYGDGRTMAFGRFEVVKVDGKNVDFDEKSLAAK